LHSSLLKIQIPLRIDMKGNLLNRNPTAEQLTTFVHNVNIVQSISLSTLLHKLILTKSWILKPKLMVKNIPLYKTIKDLGCINIYGRT
jgi:hypothetical protein